MPLRRTQVVCIRSWALFIAEECSMMWVEQSLVNHSRIEGLGCLQFGAIMNKVAMKFTFRCLCKLECSFLWNKCPRLQLLGPPVSTHLLLLRICRTVFQNGCAIFHACQQGLRPIFFTPLPF